MGIYGLDKRVKKYKEQERSIPGIVRPSFPCTGKGVAILGQMDRIHCVEELVRGIYGSIMFGP